MVSGEDAARCVLDLVEKDNRLCRSLRPLSVLLDAAKESLIRCRIVLDAGIQRVVQSGDRRVAFEAIAELRACVYAVRLREDTLIDHAVVVDAKNGVIIDSEESGALALSADILERCGGERAKKLRLCEIRG